MAMNARNVQMTVGKILYDCRGYSMTWYDFYEIIKVTNCTVTLQKLQKRTVGGTDGFMPEVEPIRVYDTREKPITKRIKSLYMSEHIQGQTYNENYLD